MEKPFEGNLLFTEVFEDKFKLSSEGRLHYTSSTPNIKYKRSDSSSDNILEENLTNIFNMKLRSTVADSKFIEQSSNNINSETKRNQVNYEKYKPEDIFDLTYTEGNYSVNIDTDPKTFEDEIYKKKSSIDRKLNRLSTSDSFDSDFYDGDLTNFDLKDFIAQTKSQYEVYNERKSSIKCDSNDISLALREIAKQVELNNFKNNSTIISYEDQLLCFKRKINLLTGELDRCYKELDIVLKQLEENKSKYENRISELESNIRQLVSIVKKDSQGIKTSADNSDQLPEAVSTTLPSVTLEDLDEKSKLFQNKLIKYLYSDVNESDTGSFLPSLYKSLREFPDVVDSGDLVRYIKESIGKDSQVINSRLSQTSIVSEDKYEYDSVSLVPQSNKERQVISELESTLQFLSISTNNSISHSLNRDQSNLTKTVKEESYVKTHVIMNRNVLEAIFRFSNINNLYNYLFEALRCDNFRVVEIISQSVWGKFMDLEMVQEFSKNVKHPIMWSFGDNSNCNQCLRYIKVLNFNFLNFPKDPTTGDNMWHLVARGSGSFLAQKLKSYSMYSEYLKENNKSNETPIDISKGLTKREFYINLIVDLASRGSEMYRKGSYEKSLDYYTDAIVLQQNLITLSNNNNLNTNSDSYNYTNSSKIERLERPDRQDKENMDINMGKLYYNKARTLMHLNRWIEAIECCELCLKHIPNYCNAYDTCIQAYELLLDWNNAANTCIAMRDNCGLLDEEKYQRILDQKEATFFQLLDIDKNASSSDIKKAFNTMCKMWHPDKIDQNLSQDMKRRSINHFNRLFDAREKLMDPTTKSIQQMKKETNYKIPMPYINFEKNQESNKDDNNDLNVEFRSKDQVEAAKCVNTKQCSDGSSKKITKNNDPDILKSRMNLNELTMERLKFINSINLLKGQAIFDFDSLSWGQL